MTTRMPAIDTRYNGYRFRSRLEARWAVAFDALSVPYEYEPQGFRFAAGAYLPDFWLPQSEQWVEIKGHPPTDREFLLAQQLANASGHQVAILVGQIPQPTDKVLNGDLSCGRMVYRSDHALHGSPHALGVAPFHHGERYCGVFRFGSLHDKEWTCWCGAWMMPWEGDELEDALTAARSARFEHGETPRVRR